MYDRIKSEYDAVVASQPRNSIKVTLADGRLMDGFAWQTTPFDIAKLLGTFVLDDLMVARVNGTLYDLSRPLESDCILEFLDFENPEGQNFRSIFSS